MIFNAVVALMIVAIPVIWSTKGKGFGLFTAFLAAVCALASGAIAFAAWEPTANFIMGLSASASGFVGDALQSNAYGLGLLVPYLAALALTRIAIDSLVKANLEFSDLTNTLGGIAFGAVVSLITVGVLATSIGYMRLGPAILGYTPIEERDGNPVYASKLWIPVDGLVVELYERLSMGAFSAPTPLAVHAPDAHIAGHMQRMTFRGAARNTLLRGDFEVLGTYTVAGPVATILSDTFLVGPDGSPKRQTVTDSSGQPAVEGSTLHGYLIKFNSGAKEKQGNTIMGVGQIRLIATTQDGQGVGLQPIACVAPPDAGAEGLYRFRFDAPEVFISSKGGASEVTFGFEFAVPPGATPTALIVKNVRVPLEGSAIKSVAFAAPAQRDQALRTSTILASFGASTGGLAGPVDKAGSIEIKLRAASAGNRAFEDFDVGDALPEGYIFNKTNRGQLTVNDDNRLSDGDHTIAASMMNERGIDKNLRVDRFAVSSDVGIVQVRLAAEGTRTPLGRSFETADRSGTPLLVDEKGRTYEAVGFAYAEGETVRLRYTPGRPIRSASEIPALSRTKTDQTLWLIFLPTKGAKITAFNVGNKELASLPGGLTVR